MLRLVIISTLFLFTACKTVTKKDNMDITLEISNYPVVIHYSKKYQYIWRVDVPVKATLKNNSFLRKMLDKVKYNYRDSNYKRYATNKSDQFVRIYSDKQGILKKTLKHKRLYFNEELSYILKLSLRLDTTYTVQKKYEKYLTEVSQNNLDTLIIGTINELKQTNKDLIKQINKGDLCFEFTKNKSVQTDNICVTIDF